jgi:inosose dehydratase
MTIRLGANPIIWSNDDMRELGGETPLETCLAQARAIGFEGMELGHKFPREARALAAALRPFDLACVSGWYSGQLLERDARAELAQLRPHLELLRAMGSTVSAGARCRSARRCLKVSGHSSDAA